MIENSCLCKQQASKARSDIFTEMVAAEISQSATCRVSSLCCLVSNDSITSSIFGLCWPDIYSGFQIHIISASCENMIDGKGMRPGDVLTGASGKTVEVPLPYPLFADAA